MDVADDRVELHGREILAADDPIGRQLDGEAGRLVDAVDKAVRACAAARARSRALEAILDDPTQDTQAHLDKSRWDNALSTLWMAYQPIVLPSGKLYAYEALVRSEEPTMRGAGDLLDMAESLHGLVALGRTVREKVGLFAAATAGSHYVFVNLHADDLLDEMLTSREQAPVSYTHLTLPTNREV